MVITLSISKMKNEFLEIHLQQKVAQLSEADKKSKNQLKHFKNERLLLKIHSQDKKDNYQKHDRSFRSRKIVASCIQFIFNVTIDMHMTIQKKLEAMKLKFHCLRDTTEDKNMPPENFTWSMSWPYKVKVSWTLKLFQLYLSTISQNLLLEFSELQVSLKTKSTNMQC